MEPAALYCDRWRGQAGHAPITLHADPDDTASDRHRALAGLRIADAVLVNSTYDGFIRQALARVRTRPFGPVLFGIPQDASESIGCPRRPWRQRESCLPRPLRGSLARWNVAVQPGCTRWLSTG